MTRTEMVWEMKKLEYAFNREFTQNQSELWFEIFKDENSEDFKSAILKSIKECRYFPTIADVRGNFLNNWNSEEGRL